MRRLLTLFLILFSTITFAQEPALVKDLETEPADADPGSFTPMGKFLYFSANDGIHGKALWRTDGTAANTRVVEDKPSNVVPYLVVNDILFFRGDDEEHGLELWKTDGKTRGAVLIKDIYPGPLRGVSSTEFAAMDGWLYFVADDSIHGDELWKSGGTEEGTTLVKDIRQNGDADPENFMVSNGVLYFRADDGEHGEELWRSDGTEEGTVLVEDIAPGATSSFIDGMITVNKTLFFTANDGVHGRELWKTEGKETVMVKDIAPDDESSSPQGLVNFLDKLYFFAQDQLWKSDGTEASTEVVVPVDGVTSGNPPMQVEDVLFFAARDEKNGVELWETNGTREGTMLVKDIRRDTGSSSPRNFIRVNKTLFFTANDGENGRGLWKSDGTEKGTVLVRELDLALDNNASFSPQLTSFQEKVFFKNKDKATGIELWVSDGTKEGTDMLKDIHPETIGSAIYSFQLLQNQLIFSKEPQDKLWKTDGTEVGTVFFKEVIGTYGLTQVNDNTLLFASGTEDTGFELWKTDGTADGTQPVKDIQPGDGSSLDLHNTPLPSLNGIMFFPADDGEHGEELWKTDGTAAGTQMIKDINDGFAGSSLYLQFPNTHAIYKNKLYFGAVGAREFLDRELWVSDGTEIGTVIVKEINQQGSADPFHFTEANGILFFSATTASSSRELWKTDGTDTGPVMIKDIHPGENSGLPEITNAEDLEDKRMINFNGTLFFSGNDGDTGFELWKTDGTQEGTTLIKNIRFGIEGSSPAQFTVVNNTLLFIADDGEHGLNLWKTDGTEAGTSIVTTTVTFNHISELTTANGTVFFIADNGNQGKELWKTDGTEAGTHRVSDIVPGSDAITKILEYNEGILYFSADDDQHGEELWALKALTMEVSLAANSTEICTQDDTLTFTASVTNAGDNPQYHWFINDVLVENQSNASLSIDALSDGDEVKVQLIAGKEVWVRNDSLFSETITIQFSSSTSEISVEGTQLTATEGASYQWFFNGELLPDETQAITATATGHYQVEVTNDKGCSFLSEEVEVTVCEASTPTIQAEGFSLTTSAAGSYRWFLDGELLTDTTQTIEVTKSGNYQVEVTDEQGCTALSDIVAIDLCSNFTATLIQDGTILIASEGVSYQWFLDGEPFPNDTQSIEAEESGTYQVEVTDSLGCTALSEEVNITVTGIEDEILARQLRMYPNPVASHLKIDAKTHEEVRIFIYNISGKQVHESLLIPQNAHHAISLHHLTPGLYMVRFIGEKGTHQRKLMKQ